MKRKHGRSINPATMFALHFSFALYLEIQARRQLFRGMQRTAVILAARGTSPVTLPLSHDSCIPIPFACDWRPLRRQADIFLLSSHVLY